MKAMRVAVKVLIWVVVVVVAAVLTLPMWMGPVVTTVANAVVPDIVKTDFRLEHVSLNPYTARFELGGLRLSNPTGYSERYAVTVGDVAFDAKTFSLLTDVIHIEEIKIKDIFVSYLNGGPEKINNFQQIQYNVAGGREAYEAAQAAKNETEPYPGSPAEDLAVRKPAASAGSEKRFIIDRLEISGLMVQLGFLPIRQPMPLVVTDIGLKTGGATVSEVFQQVWNEILRQAGVVGDQMKALGVEAVNKTSQRAGVIVNQTTTQATGAVNDSVKAVEDGAKKAIESLKRLW